jgi:hypothetical protein
MRSDAVRAVALLITAVLGQPALSAAPPDQAAASEYEVKAVFVHHLTRYLQWPQPAAASSFEIAVLGRSAIAPPLRAIAAKQRIRDLPIAIRAVDDIASLGQPQVLFVASPAAPHLAEVLRRTRGRPILTIAEEEGLAGQGVAVNFVLREGSVRFEINEAALRGSGIQPGAQLLRLAILVRGPG